MAKFILVDSLSFISIDGLYRAMGEKNRDNETPQYCDACFTNDYPIKSQDNDNGTIKKQLSLLTEIS